LGYYTNFSIVVLVLPAIMGGRFIYYFLGLKDLFLVSAGLKYLGLFILFIGGVLFFLFFSHNILLFKSILWGTRSLWILPLFSSRIFLRNIFNVGDYFHKIRDYSWTYYIFSNFYITINGAYFMLSFQKNIFIIILRNILIFSFLITFAIS
jgi:hypothetical protein